MPAQKLEKSGQAFLRRCIWKQGDMELASRGAEKHVQEGGQWCKGEGIEGSLADSRHWQLQQSGRDTEQQKKDSEVG